jgi:hypothetical protein
LSAYPDPFDFADINQSVVVKQKAVIVRTDFSDDAAWAKLRATVEADEREGWQVLSSSNPADDHGEDESSDEDGDESGEEPMDVETAINTAANSGSGSTNTAPDSRAFIFVENPVFNGASNLQILRALCDLRIVKAHSLPLDFSGKSPAPNRIMGRDGLREIYVGPQIWVQDSQSNADNTLRVVRNAGAQYATAT